MALNENGVCAVCGKNIPEEERMVMPDGREVCAGCFQKEFEERRGSMRPCETDIEEAFIGDEVRPERLAEWFDYDGSSTMDGMQAELYTFSASVLYDDPDAMEAAGADPSFVEDFLMYYGLSFEVTIAVHEDRILFVAPSFDEEQGDPFGRPASRRLDLAFPAQAEKIAANLLGYITDPEAE